MLNTMMKGVYQRAKRSMKRCVGAFSSWASSTRAMMRARVVSAPTPVARTFSVPFWFRVPAYTASPLPFSSGIDSPVMALSSTAEKPSSTSPSTGTLAPGLINKISSCATSLASTSTCCPSRITTAVVEARSSSWPSTSRVLLNVRASR